MTGLFPVDDVQKLAAVKRELALRRSVYPRRVDAGKMTQRLADEQISVMEAIVADYERSARKAHP